MLNSIQPSFKSAPIQANQPNQNPQAPAQNQSSPIYSKNLNQDTTHFGSGKRIGVIRELSPFAVPGNKYHHATKLDVSAAYSEAGNTAPQFQNDAMNLADMTNYRHMAYHADKNKAFAKRDGLQKQANNIEQFYKAKGWL